MFLPTVSFIRHAPLSLFRFSNTPAPHRRLTTILHNSFPNRLTTPRLFHVPRAHLPPHPFKAPCPTLRMLSSADSSSTTAMLHKANLIDQALTRIYPNPPDGFLHHTNPFTLLIAVLLSAQSLDSKVNQVTPELFRLADTPEKMRALGEDKIRMLIKQIGLAPQKAKNICKLSQRICDEFQGNVPSTFEGLESLAGVGHKTASVVMMQAFGKPAFPVDTHIHRLACRWGCGDPKSVEKTEAALKTWFPDRESWGKLHVRMILFGREYCPARKHDMDQCPVCSFAATDESRRANDIHSNKFVAALRHRNPYSIREVQPVEGKQVERESGDEEYVPESMVKRAKVRNGKPRRRGSRVKGGDVVEERRVVDSSKRRGDGVGADADGEGMGNGTQTRRSARLERKREETGTLGVKRGEKSVKRRKRSSPPSYQHAGDSDREVRNLKGNDSRTDRQKESGFGQEINVK